MSMTQTKALFVDAYRELNARKMFWITLVLSGLVVAIFALVGINERGLVLAFWTIEAPGINTEFIPESMFYKSLFTGLGINIWLTWIAAILALISTASIFPDLVTAGSVDMVLSKPISRLRLFVTKYLFGLLFVTLQVSVFSVASFFVLGLRGGVWEPVIFLAIPIVVIFFSYLFGICATLGILTRSTIASLLLTILIWFLIFIMNTADSTVLMFKTINRLEVERTEQRIDVHETTLARLESSDDRTEQIDAQIAREREDLEEIRLELVGSQSSYSTISTIHDIVFLTKTVLPKTSETVGLVERYMIDMGEFEAAPDSGSSDNEFGVNQQELQMEIVAELRDRPVWWIVGTSLIFEFVILSFGAWRFCRRDF